MMDLRLLHPPGPANDDKNNIHYYFIHRIIGIADIIDICCKKTRQTRSPCRYPSPKRDSTA